MIGSKKAGWASEDVFSDMDHYALYLSAYVFRARIQICCLHLYHLAGLVLVEARSPVSSGAPKTLAVSIKWHVNLKDKSGAPIVIESEEGNHRVVSDVMIKRDSRL